MNDSLYSPTSDFWKQCILEILFHRIRQEKKFTFANRLEFLLGEEMYDLCEGEPDSNLIGEFFLSNSKYISMLRDLNEKEYHCRYGSRGYGGFQFKIILQVVNSIPIFTPIINEIIKNNGLDAKKIKQLFLSPEGNTLLHTLGPENYWEIIKKHLLHLDENELQTKLSFFCIVTEETRIEAKHYVDTRMQTPENFYLYKIMNIWTEFGDDIVVPLEKIRTNGMEMIEMSIKVKLKTEKEEEEEERRKIEKEKEKEERKKIEKEKEKEKEERRKERQKWRKNTITSIIKDESSKANFSNNIKNGRKTKREQTYIGIKK